MAMPLKLKISLFISLTSVFSICSNNLQIASAEDVKPGIVNLRVFTPKNSSFMFKVDLPLFGNKSNPFKFGQEDNEEGEVDKMGPQVIGMRKMFHVIYPSINGIDSNGIIKEKDGENAVEEKVETTSLKNNEQENKFPRLKLFIFKKKDQLEELLSPDSSGNNSTFNEDCDQLNNDEQNEVYVQNVKNNTENVPATEGKNETIAPTLTDNTAKLSSVDETPDSIEAEALELERELQELQEAQKNRFVLTTSRTETAQGDLVTIIVTATVALILLLIIIMTVVNYLRVRRHRHLLDIEKFRKENGAENTTIGNNQQDIYRWIKARINPSHFKAHRKGQDPSFPENPDPHMHETKNGNIYSINPDITR